jgi:RHS repeat-associated protein
VGKHSRPLEYDLRSQLAAVTPRKIKIMKHHKRASFVTYLMAALIAFVLTGATSSFAAKKTIHFYNDISGSPQLAVDADSGQVLWKETYKPYGERINNSPASASGQGKNELYFHGKQQEALNNGISIQYFGARYYEPSIGRFLGVDPIHFDQKNIHSFNRYAYANNNPYKYYDPTGEAGECQHTRNCGGLGGYDGSDRTLGVLTAQSLGFGAAAGEIFDMAIPQVAGAAAAKAFSLLAAGRTSPQLFRNLAPGTDSRPAGLFSASDVQKSLYSDRLQYVVTESDGLALGKGGHTALANGRDVLAAGEVKFVNGGIRSINNQSGHYRPSGASAQGAAGSAFQKAGFDSAGKYVEGGF